MDWGSNSKIIRDVDEWYMELAEWRGTCLAVARVDALATSTKVRVEVGVCERRLGLCGQSRESHQSSPASHTYVQLGTPPADSPIAAFFFRQHRSRLVSIPSVIPRPPAPPPSTTCSKSPPTRE
jgi:hypothetical protein